MITKIAALALVVSILMASSAMDAWAKDAPITECDRLMSDRTDPDRVFDVSNVPSNIPKDVFRICSDALARYPDSLRLKFLMARVEITTSNHDLGLTLLRDAAGRGYRHAMFVWGNYLANLDYAGAILSLGFLDMPPGPARNKGDIDPQSAAAQEGVAYIRRAAGMDHPLAQFVMGQLHEVGTLVAKSSEKSLFWYHELARHMPGRGENAIGLHDLNQVSPTGPYEDFQEQELVRKAKRHLRKGAEHGDLNAKAILGDMLIDAWFESERDVEKGLAMVTEAGEEGNPTASAVLIKLYTEGEATEKDLEKARYFACKSFFGKFLYQETTGERLACPIDR